MISSKTQARFCTWFTEINPNFFPSEPKFRLILKVGPSTKKLFLQLSAWNDELLSTPKTVAFLAVPLSKRINLNYQMFFRDQYTHTFSLTIFFFYASCSK